MPRSRPRRSERKTRGTKDSPVPLLFYGRLACLRESGATERSVRRWRQSKSLPPKRNSRRREPGRPGRLRTFPLRRLLCALERGACYYGYAEDYWTLDRIAHLIWELFRVRYRSHSVWSLLQRLGWSCQKPQRRALHRDGEAMAHWQHYVWPQIKTVAAAWRDPGFSRCKWVFLSLATHTDVGPAWADACDAHQP